MKQIIKSYTLLIVSCFLLAGCNSEEDIGAWGEPVAVQFGISEIPCLKTTAGGDQWTLNDPVGIFMVKNGQALNTGNIAEGADNVEYKAQTGGSNQSGFIPVSGTPIFYPQNGDKVDFIAYYPYKSSLTNYTYPVDVSNQATPADIDVLYANTADTYSSGYNKNSSTVDLQFNHLLSKLSFTLTSGDGSPSLAGVKIQITNLITTVDMSLADGTFTATNSGQTLTANTAANGLSSSAIVIPQNLSGTKLIVTLADNVSVFEWTFTDIQLEQGKNHQYNITVSKTGITVSSSGITMWTGTGEPATPGMAEQIKYQVGDYYPYPEDPKNAIGVIFQITDGIGYQGKMIDLDWIQRYVYVNGTQYPIRWGDPTVDEAAAGVSGIKDSEDGYEGTKNLIIKRKDQANFAVTYCLFNWIYQAKNNGNVNGWWYLPSPAEMRLIFLLRATLDPKIVLAGGREIPNGYFWVSAERNISESWIVVPSGVMQQTHKATATWAHYALAIRKF